MTLRSVLPLGLLVAQFGSSAQSAVVSLPATLKAKPMQDVVVPVRVSPGTGVTAMDFAFEYDETVAVPTGAFRTGATDGFTVLDVDFTEPGVVSLTLAGGGPLSGSPDVAWIVFRMVGASGTFTDLVWTEATLNAGAVTSTTQNGRLTAISAAASVGSPDDPIGAPGAQVLVSIFAEPATGGEGFDLAVRFNPNVIVPISVTTTPLTAGMSLTANLAVPGEVRVGLFGTSPVNGSGPLVNVRYSVVGSLSERTPLDVFRGDINEQTISSGLDDGLFTVCTSADGDGDGFSSCAGDCNDAQATINPGADESCNGIDDDCSGGLDDGIAAPAGAPLLELGRDAVNVLLSWSAVAGSTGYDVVRGQLNTLRSTHGDYSAATDSCSADEQPGTAIAIPGGGPDAWYLVRAVNCGGAGTYDGGSAQQAAPRDASIGASPSACP